MPPADDAGPGTDDAREAAGLVSLFGLFSLFDRMPGIAAITDRDGGLLYLNGAGRTLCDIGRGAPLAGESLLDRYSGAAREFVLTRVIPCAVRNGFWCGETALAGGRGQVIPLWQVTVFHRDRDTGRELLATLAWDISTRKDLERNLWHQATHDALTGLPNRTLLMDRLAQAIHGAQRSAHFTAALLMDVDGFKDINDSLGHETGNQVLSELAVRLYSCVRAGDTVGRYGGDEFVFILCDLHSSEEVEQVVQRVREAMRTPFFVGDLPVYVGASIGVAIHPDDGADAASLLRHADQAMYRMKESRGTPRRSQAARHGGSLAFGSAEQCDVLATV